MSKEIWKQMVGYEGMYDVSNFGRVKSLERYYKFFSTQRYLPERIMNPNKGIYGYEYYYFYKDGKRKTLAAHQLVAICFLGHNLKDRNIVVDHINHITNDNRVENLQLLTARQNTSKRDKKLRKDYTSKYVGVYKKKGAKSFTSAIRINGDVCHLGLFIDEAEAGELYQLALKNIEKFNGDKNQFRSMLIQLKKAAKK